MRWIFLTFLITTIIAEEKITSHQIQLEETLFYATTVSTGKVSYIAYIKETTENRPITFAFNGGPGSSSCWLHMSTFGPKRLLSTEEGGSLLPPHELVDNLETILDLTDLVFIDPSATGFSELDDNAYSVMGDIQAVSLFIRDYITEKGRWNSPKYLAGESYGAIRASGIAEFAGQNFGIYFNGALLISAAIDFSTLIFGNDNPLPYALYLPTYAATAWYHKKAHENLSLEEVVNKARKFAFCSYLPALYCSKCFDLEDLYPTISEMTGLPLKLVEKRKGKIADSSFFHDLFFFENKVIGRFDSRISGHTPEKNVHYDPSLSNIMGPIASAIQNYLAKDLDISKSYTIFSDTAYEKWQFNNYNQFGYPNLMDGLRSSLITNPSMKIFVACGLFDLATPFATMEYCMDHLDIPNVSIQMEYYEGGHMFYVNPDARRKFKQDLIKFYR